MVSDNCCKIGDFGFSKILVDEMQSTYAGTPITMAPEQLQQQPYDARADIWSLGVIYYQLLHNQYPFIANSQKELLKKQEEQQIEFKSSLSNKSRDFIKKCLTFDYQRRMNWDTLFKHPLFHSNLYMELSICQNNLMEIQQKKNHQQDIKIIINRSFICNKDYLQDTTCQNQQLDDVKNNIDNQNENEKNQLENQHKDRDKKKNLNSKQVQYQDLKEFQKRDGDFDQINFKEVDKIFELSEQEKQRLLQIDLNFSQNNQIINQQWSTILYLSKLEVQFCNLTLDLLDNSQNIHSIDIDLAISSQHLCHLQIIKKLETMNLGLREHNVMNLYEFKKYIKTEYVKQLKLKIDSYILIYQHRQEELKQTISLVNEKKKNLNNQSYLINQTESQQNEIVIFSYQNQQYFEKLVNIINRMDIQLIKNFTKNLLAIKFSQQNQLKIKQLLFWWNVQDAILIESFLFNQDNKIFNYSEYWQYKKGMKIEEIFRRVFLNSELLDQL